jgi:uncharacterized delta-60 repeat protein
MELDRLNPDGSFDASFGSGGIVSVTPPANTYYEARDVAIESDGKIVVAGFSSTGGFLLARIKAADGSLDSGFGAGGVAVASGNNANDAVGVALEQDGRIVVASTQPTGSGGFTLARVLAYGPEVGSFTASPNPATAGGSLTLTAGNISDEIPSASITRVAFYAVINGTNTLLGYGTQSGAGVWAFTFSTAGWAPGTYTLSAVAEDSYGVFGDPLAITVTLN